LLILSFSFAAVSIPNTKEKNKINIPLVEEFNLAVNAEFQVEFYRP